MLIPTKIDSAVHLVRKISLKARPSFKQKKTNMPSLIIGSDTEGNKVSKSLPALRNLFVSYLDDTQIKNLLENLLVDSNNNIVRLLFIAKEANLIDTTTCKNTESYVYNNPEIGSIKNKNHLFAQIVKEQKKHNSKMTLICIDDMWQFYPRFTSKIAINHFRQLLQYGYNSNIHFVIGSILPYRNLLVQLMRSDTLGGNKHVVSTLGAELIYSPDELIFFRGLDTEIQEMYYPIKEEGAIK